MELKELLKKAIAYHPVLAETFGGIKEAVYLQQIIFWSDKGKRKDGWIYKTIKDFEEETYIKKGSQERLRKKFIELKIIEVKIVKALGTPKTHFKLDWKVLKKHIEFGLAETRKVRNSESPKTGTSDLPKTGTSDLPKTGKSSITENTSEITSEIYTFFLKKINPNSKLLKKAKEKIKERLKIFTSEELKKAIDNFSQDNWKMKHNASRGIAWFFHSDDRVESYVNLKNQQKPKFTKYDHLTKKIKS